jgi:signal transduction histidine kinase
MLATRSPVPVVVDRDLERALPRGHETALYFVAAEALTNVAKYARASIARLTLRADEKWAEVSIADDGVGGAQPEHGSGLRGLSDRVEALGGQLTIASAIAKGTTVTARIPMTKTASAAISQLAGQA